jgi:lipopolysaccharide transport protein LptA
MIGIFSVPRLSGLAADQTTVGEKQSDPTPVHITSDKVLSDQNEKWVEFIGNVQATQEGSVITADRIKIFYKTGDGNHSDPVGSQAVQKMIALGQVRILFDNKSKSAAAEKAEYTAEDKILVLSGGNPSVTSGQDVIRGEKITLYQGENRTVVEGGEKKQVEATFYSQEEGGLIK